MDPEALKELGLAIGIEEFKLDVLEQLAMKEDANLTWEMLRKIKMHLIQAGADILVPEYIMRLQQAAILEPHQFFYQDSKCPD